LPRRLDEGTGILIRDPTRLRGRELPAFGVLIGCLRGTRGAQVRRDVGFLVLFEVDGYLVSVATIAVIFRPG
jgi:hypothetical protein